MGNKMIASRNSRSVAIALWVATLFAVCAANAAEKFAAERPTPLRMVRDRIKDPTITRFTGTAQLNGKFMVVGKVISPVRRVLQIIFIPDRPSAGLLPHAIGTDPVEYLFFANNQRAASMLLTPEMTNQIAVGEILRVEGEATIEITDYRAVVECDHRWYVAQLASVITARAAMESKNENGSLEC